jgi:hypothetical protein
MNGLPIRSDRYDRHASLKRQTFFPKNRKLCRKMLKLQSHTCVSGNSIRRSKPALIAVLKKPDASAFRLIDAAEDVAEQFATNSSNSQHCPNVNTYDRFNTFLPMQSQHGEQLRLVTRRDANLQGSDSRNEPRQL